MSRAKKKFKVGDVVVVTYNKYNEESGEIIKQGRIDSPDLWWVKLDEGGRIVRFNECWLKKVKPKKPKPARVRWIYSGHHLYINKIGPVAFATIYNSDTCKRICNTLNRLERKIARLEGAEK